MRTMALCIIAATLVGCHSGPRWFLRDRGDCGRAHCSDQSAYEPVSEPPSENLQLPPLPADKEKDATPQTSASSRRATKNSATKTIAAKAPNRKSSSTQSRATSSQDEATKQLLADLEKTKREKASIEAKLSEQSAKQTQQRLELEARIAVLQEQLRQLSTLQPVSYQQPVPRTNSGYTPTWNNSPPQQYHGPIINSGAPSPTPSVPQSLSNYGGTLGSTVPTWNSATPAWNPQPQGAANSTPSMDMWPFSPQRR